MTDEQRQRAPKITLKAAGSGRQVTLDSEGVPLALVCVGQGTAGSVDAIRTAIRERWPEARSAMIASVIDLRAVPRLMRKMAEGALANRYKENTARLPEGRNPRDYIVILPDWKGEVIAALGVADVTATPAVAVINAAGKVAGVYQGDDPARAAVDLLERAGA
jgi:hypothetical protein